MLDWRLAAYRRWVQLEEPTWAMQNNPQIDIMISITTPNLKSMAEKPSLWMTLIRSCWRPMQSWASR